LLKKLMKWFRESGRGYPKKKSAEKLRVRLDSKKSIRKERGFSEKETKHAVIKEKSTD